MMYPNTVIVCMSAALRRFQGQHFHCETDGSAIVTCLRPPELNLKNSVCYESIDLRAAPSSTA